MTTELGSSAHESLVKDRAIRVFKFLRDLTQLRSKIVRDSSQYDVWWLSDLPREPGCYFVGWHPIPEVDPGTPWIEIRKPRFKPPPAIPANLEPWVLVDLSDSTVEQPALQEILEVQPEDADSPSQILLLEDHPEISSQWEAYLGSQWFPWATQDRIQQSIQAKYSTLFSIYQKQKTLGENYEVVVSLGYFNWRSKSNYEVARHLITAQASITFDDVRGVIRVSAAADGARLALEHDMLDVDDRPQADDIEDQLRDCEFLMWDGQTIPDVLRGWVYRLSAEGEYSDSLTSTTMPGPRPSITLAPAIVMRRRSERTILRLLKDLIARFESGKQPSAGVEHLVAVIENRAYADEDGGDQRDLSPHQPAGELFLPLPANEEQRLIVEKLQRNQGVLVQGPPGTGKSHTIANLLCHLLANGKRVLVTSHTARALAVLRDKLPPEIADLCVQLLGNDLSALQGLENSVREITERYNDRNEERSIRRIAALEKSLHETRKAMATCQHDLRSIREADTVDHEAAYGDYRGTTQKVAQQVRERQSSFEWIAGLVDDSNSVPMTDAEAIELLDLQEIVDESMVAAAASERPRLEEIPDPYSFAAAVQVINESKAQSDALFSAENQGHVSRLKDLSEDDLIRVQSAVQSVARVASAFDSGEPWLHSCRADIIARNSHIWAELFASTDRYLARLGDRAQWATEREVTRIDGLDEMVALVDATALHGHFEKGGRLGFGPFRATVVKRTQYIVRNVRINGTPCRTQETVKELCTFLEVKRELQNLGKLWAHVVTAPTASIAIQAAYFTSLRERLASMMELRELAERADATWTALGGTELLWMTVADLQRVVRAFDYACAVRKHGKALRPLDALVRRMRQTASRPGAHEVTQMLANAVSDFDSEAYANAYSYLAAVEEAATRVRRRDTLAQRLSVAASNLLEYMSTTTDRTELRQRLAHLSAAWQWVQADSWLRRITDPAEKTKLESEIERCKKAERKFITELASEKAWASCFKTMTLEQRRHLVAWQQEIKKLGKGTGRHAGRHRQQAREELDGARGAVPAWIMPVYRLADTINVDSDRFDVIIIDEASQSGPDAMFLLEFAKQVVIVGDDKQIKPDVFVNQDVVDKLRRQYIPDIPSSTVIGSVDTSLFEIGELLYGGRVRLREHFRCMPEIIQFSNNLCYRTEPLIPLRQFGQSRLKPVVSTRHAKEGYQKGRPGRIVNEPEAEAVVDFVVAAMKDSAYVKKSFGIISLLGEDQAKLIEQMLLERIGPEEMQRRQLVCGDAYAFQGDERDIMLLSMVSAPTAGAHIGVLSKQTDERRFNVAASRARDQMILFHTVTLADLNPNCMRHKLLEYCLNPRVDPLEVAGLKLEELRALALSESKRHGRPPDPFDSWFEVDVCIQIMEHGYRVVPQYEVAGYYVDLMVEGMNGRIAVECDGDAWHGPEQFDSDTFRQRELERAGLRFFRPRGTEFYRGPTSCLEPLWNLLTEKVPSVNQPSRNDSAIRAGQVDVVDVPDSEHDDHLQDSASLEQAVPITGPAEQSPYSSPAAFDEVDLVNENGQESSLPPYLEWPLIAMPDPRSCSADEIIRGFIQIVRVEGPVVWSRVYRRYARAAGIQRVGHQLRSMFNRAAARAARSGLVEQSEDGIGQMSLTVWLPNAPAVIVRQRGPRAADEIPASEVAAVGRRISSDTPMSIDQLIERVSEEFAIGRLTVSTRDILRKALERQRSSA